MVVTLIIVSAFLHALWNVLLSRQPDRDVIGNLMLLAAGAWSAALAALLLVFADIVLFASPAAIFWAVLSGFTEAGYFAFLLLAYRKAPLGAVYTITRSVGILAAWPVAILWQAEAINLEIAIGTLLVIIGLAVASLRHGFARDGMLLAAISGVFVAAYNILYKQAIIAGAHPTAVFCLSVFIAVSLILLTLNRSQLGRVWPTLRQRAFIIFGLGSISAASFLLMLWAFIDAGAGYAITLRNVSLLFALALAAGFGEHISRRQLFGGGLIIAGAILLSLNATV